MEITITKTVQIKPYEPVTVTVKEEAPVKTNEDYEHLKKKVSACLEDTLVHEIEKYRE